MRHTPSRNPYRNTRRRRAALAFLTERGLTEVRPIYPPLCAPMRQLPPVGKAGDA